MLIYFIHHLSVGVQSSDIIATVAYDLIYMIEFLQESASTQKIKDISDEKKYKDSILSSKIGYLQTIDYQGLLSIAKKHQLVIDIYFRPGNFIRQESVLAAIGSNDLSKKLKYVISKAFLIGKERSPTQVLNMPLTSLSQ